MNPWLGRIHALVGLISGIFIVAHLAVQSTTIQGDPAYQTHVDTIRKTFDRQAAVSDRAEPASHAAKQTKSAASDDEAGTAVNKPLSHQEIFLWAVVYVPFAIYVLLGLYLFADATGQPTDYPYTTKPFFQLQWFCGLLFVAFAIFHAMEIRYNFLGYAYTFSPQYALLSVHRSLREDWWQKWIAYPLGVIAACYFLASTVWTAAVAFRLTVSSVARKRFAWACGLLFVITAALGFTAIIGADRYHPRGRV